MDYAMFRTPLGWMLIAGSERGITQVVLPASNEDGALARLCLRAGISGRDACRQEPSFFGTLAERLTGIMSGHPAEFPDRLDSSGWSEFQYRVWDATRQIGYGEVRSYAWVAASSGRPRAFRAVGQALHNNPVPIIVPCHRVIGSDGSLTGFGNGLELKRRLLSLEAGGHGSSGNAI